MKPQPALLAFLRVRLPALAVPALLLVLATACSAGASTAFPTDSAAPVPTSWTGAT